MIGFFRFLTTPVYLLSFMFHILIAFAWNDGKLGAMEKVFSWQSREGYDIEEDDDEEDK